MARVSNEPETIKLDEVDLDQIMVDEAQNMRHFPPSAKAIQELKADIEVNGLLQPVVVRPFTVLGYKYALVAGFQRMRALTEIGGKIKVLVRVIDAEDQGAIFANLSENMKRNTLSAIDISHAIGKLADGESTPVLGEDNEPTGEVTVITPGLSLKEIAQQLGIGHGYASELNKMRGLRAAIQKKIHTGDITGKLARALVGMTEEQQDEILAKAESGEVSQNVLADTAKGKAKGKRKYKARGEGDGEGEGSEGGSGKGKAGKKPLTTKGAILVLDELAAKPVAGEDGELPEEYESTVQARAIFGVFLKFMNGKIGQGALVNQVIKVIQGE
jgi:ParB family transcriptional regulator, chromosome partitioning protein